MHYWDLTLEFYTYQASILPLRLTPALNKDIKLPIHLPYGYAKQ